MLVLAFEGWYQCRLPTDPDPTNEKWGITGPTYAGPGEEPLDRVIRFNDPVNLRFPFKDEDFGVAVTGVYLKSKDAFGNEQLTELDRHPLKGAKVDLLDDAKYHQRNYIMVQGWVSPIDPFHVRVRSKDGRIEISREDILVINDPEATLQDMFLDPAIVARRAQSSTTVQDPQLVAATGITDYAAHFEQRRRAMVDEKTRLEKKKPTEEIKTQIAGLTKRILFMDEMEHDSGTRVAARQFLGLCGYFDVDINGDVKISDPHHLVGGTIGTSQVWPMSFWMGSYDVDLLMGYTKGTLSLPFHADPKIKKGRGHKHKGQK